MNIAEIRARAEAATRDEHPSMEAAVAIVLNDIPALLAEVERLTAENEVSRSNSVAFANDRAWFLEQIDILTAEVNEYHAWQEGKRGVEEYLTLQVAHQDALGEIHELTARAEKAEAKNPTLSEARRLAIQWEARAREAEAERDAALDGLSDLMDSGFCQSCTGCNAPHDPNEITFCNGWQWRGSQAGKEKNDGNKL